MHVRFSLWRHHALDFERAMKIQACATGDLCAIAFDCAPHGSPAGAELLRTQRVVTQLRRQYGASVQCMEPVAGSSSMPTSGANNRHT
jgi:hypothetical protein